MSEWCVTRPEVANTPHQGMQSGDNQAQFWDRVLRLDRNSIAAPQARVPD